MALSAYRSPRRASDGDAYAPWVAELEGRSGAYVIRDASTREVLYVGESHSGRLRKTLTRHFSAWGRSKTFWEGVFADPSTADPGFTYDPRAVVVAVELTEPDDAIARQNVLIQRLRPRDNTIGKPARAERDFWDWSDDGPARPGDDDPVPF